MHNVCIFRVIFGIKITNFPFTTYIHFAYFLVKSDEVGYISSKVFVVFTTQLHLRIFFTTITTTTTTMTTRTKTTKTTTRTPKTTTRTTMTRTTMTKQSHRTYILGMRKTVLEA